jgi:acyl-CoA reductase-like NAD-dependent aldehyde dehydrogenase
MEPETTPFAMVSPLDGGELSGVTATPLESVDVLVARARGAQAGWGAKRIHDRVKAIAACKDRILDRAEAIATVIHREVGKPEIEALLGEVLPSADVVSYWCESIEELLEGAEVTLDRMAYPNKSGFIHREARGVVGVIMPWNFPFALPLRTIVPALLAGNAVLFKPSEVSPRSGQLVADIFAGLVPDGIFQLVQGGGDVGGALSAADVDLVVFTGSVASGRKVAHACAERLSPCSLELGGKDAAIVLADANLDRAAHGIVWGALTNAGQNCASVERVYVEESVATALADKILLAVRALGPGEVGPLTTRAQRAVVHRHVESAREAGAVVLTASAGDTSDAQGDFAYAPTVLRVTSDDLDVMREETFGPVIPIASVASADEALVRANASKYGLTASVWTKDIRRGEALARKLRAGVVTINNHSFTGALPAAPWSGHGDTGYGITSSPLALEALTRPRFVLVDRSRGARELWWYPYTPALRTIALSMAKLRSGSTGLFGKIRALFALLGAFPKRMKR